MRLSSYLRPAEFWILTILAAVVLVLVVVNMVLFMGNRGLQVEVASRQQYIQQSVQLETLYRAIANDLATLAVRNQDAALTAMLASHGIPVTPTLSPVAAPGAVRAGQPAARP